MSARKIRRLVGPPRRKKRKTDLDTSSTSEATLDALWELQRDCALLQNDDEIPINIDSILSCRTTETAESATQSPYGIERPSTSCNGGINGSTSLSRYMQILGDVSLREVQLHLQVSAGITPLNQFKGVLVQQKLDKLKKKIFTSNAGRAPIQDELDLYFSVEFGNMKNENGIPTVLVPPIHNCTFCGSDFSDVEIQERPYLTTTCAKKVIECRFECTACRRSKGLELLKDDTLYKERNDVLPEEYPSRVLFYPSKCVIEYGDEVKSVVQFWWSAENLHDSVPADWPRFTQLNGSGIPHLPFLEVSDIYYDWSLVRMIYFHFIGAHQYLQQIASSIHVGLLHSFEVQGGRTSRKEFESWLPERRTVMKILLLGLFYYTRCIHSSTLVIEVPNGSRSKHVLRTTGPLIVDEMLPRESQFLYGLPLDRFEHSCDSYGCGKETSDGSKIRSIIVDGCRGMCAKLCAADLIHIEQNTHEWTLCTKYPAQGSVYCSKHQHLEYLCCVRGCQSEAWEGCKVCEAHEETLRKQLEVIASRKQLPTSQWRILRLILRGKRISNPMNHLTLLEENMNNQPRNVKSIEFNAIFRKATRGQMLAALPCGYILEVRGCIGAETAYAAIDTLWRAVCNSDKRVPDIVIYDKACELYKAVCIDAWEKPSKFTKDQFACARAFSSGECRFFIDGFHLNNHKSEDDDLAKLCMRHCRRFRQLSSVVANWSEDIDHSKPGINTTKAEQIFSTWTPYMSSWRKLHYDVLQYFMRHLAEYQNSKKVRLMKHTGKKFFYKNYDYFYFD